MSLDQANIAIPVDYKANLIFRAEIIRDSANDQELQEILWNLCDKDICSFFDLFLWTYNPRKTPKDRPFILFPFQRRFVISLSNDITNGNDCLVEKSRDMGLTWMILGVFLYRWLFKSDNFLCGSRKEELVDTIGDIDTHFERYRYMIRNLPEWLTTRAGYSDKQSGHLKLFKANGASLTGESMNPDFSRQGRQNAILLDEFAFVDCAEAAWRSCGDSSPCKVVVSTPNGKNNHFARLRFGGKIKVYTFHWRDHPEKDDAWYERQKANRTAEDLAQEIDINYTVSAGKPFYQGFTRGFHVAKLTPNPNKELLLGWDFGWHHPNCNISQLDSFGRWCILDNVFGENITIDEFGLYVKQYLNSTYNGFKILSFGDPAGLQNSDKSKKTSIQILREIGFDVKTMPSTLPTTNYAARKIMIEKKLHTIISGMPGLVVNDHPNTQIVIEGFEGGYHFPKANTAGMMKESPERDGWYEHVFNSLEYTAINMFKPVENKTVTKRNYPVVRKPNSGFGF